jgi:hypothetical protein
MIGEDSGITFGLAFIIFGGLVALWWRIESRINAERDERIKLEKEFSDYRLTVQRDFVSIGVLEKTEERLIVAMDKLSARVETLISRMEGLGQELAKVAERQMNSRD